MRGKQLLLGILALIGILLITASVVFWIITRPDPAIRALQARVAALENVERIEIVTSNREWFDIPEGEAKAGEPAFVITDPEEIRLIVGSFKQTGPYNYPRWAPYWTQCGFYIRLDFYLAGGNVQTLLVGIDDCKMFTAPDIHAVAQMANDYFYEHYVRKLQP